MRILHVAEVLKGGTSSYIDEILDFQKSSDECSDIDIIAPRSQISCLEKSDGINVYTFDDSGKRVFNIFRIQLLFKKIASSKSYDIIHVHGTFAGFAVRLLRFFISRKAKLVYCAHGWAFDRDRAEWKNNLVGLIELLLSHSTDAIVCISEHDLNSAIRVGISKSKLMLIRNGITSETPPTHDIQWPEGKKRFLFVGRFDNQKGIDVFIEAIGSFDNKVFAYAVGDYSVGDQVLSRLPSNVRVMGWLSRTEVQSYFSTCDVFVMPSRWEGFGLSALEAMRAGKPVIASCVGGLPELVCNGKNGILVKPGDVDSLCVAIQEMIDSDLTLYSKASYDKFHSFFTSTRLNKDLISLYQRLTKADVANNGKIVLDISGKEYG